MLEPLQPFALYLTGLLGLLVGSFLNVVIHRYPIMLQRRWRQDASDFLQLPPPVDAEPHYSLMLPRSACPKCGHAIAWWENIPLISYALLRGRCRGCGTGISLRYPLVELLTGLAFGYVGWRYGLDWTALFYLLFGALLLTLTFIDLDHQLLPDDLTLPLLWLGLLGALLGVTGIALETALIGAMVGYLSLWSVYWAFKLLTGKDGMGYGDFKLLAALGAWLGWQPLLTVILLSSILGLTAAVLMMLFKGLKREQPIPFGPYLAMAGWIAAFWHQPLQSFYLDLIHP